MIIVNYIPKSKHKPYISIVGLISEYFDVFTDSIALQEAITEYKERFIDYKVYQLFIQREENGLKIFFCLERELNKEETEFTYSIPKSNSKPKSKYLNKYAIRLAELKKNNLWNPKQKPKNKEEDK